MQTLHVMLLFETTYTSNGSTSDSAICPQVAQSYADLHALAPLICKAIPIVLFQVRAIPLLCIAATSLVLPNHMMVNTAADAVLLARSEANACGAFIKCCFSPF